MFVANSLVSKKIYKLAQMLKDMDINVYIYGPKGSGKTFLANFIANNDDKIIENIDFIPNYKTRIIATGNKKLYDDLADIFSFQIELKPLSQRVEDVNGFIELFTNEAQQQLGINKNIEIQYNNENLFELKQKIYQELLCSDYKKDDIIKILKRFFDKNYSDEDSYSSVLKIFDKALITSLLEKYKSKLQVANKLKINRNTLSKKVKEIEE